MAKKYNPKTESEGKVRNVGDVSSTTSYREGDRRVSAQLSTMQRANYEGDKGGNETRKAMLDGFYLDNIDNIIDKIAPRVREDMDRLQR